MLVVIRKVVSSWMGRCSLRCVQSSKCPAYSRWFSMERNEVAVGQSLEYNYKRIWDLQVPSKSLIANLYVHENLIILQI